MRRPGRAPQPPPPGRPAAVVLHAEGVRVLVVEDETQLADAVVRGLRREGMAVDVAYDGDDGFSKATTTRYDVVVLDRDLPGKSGDEICRSLTDEGVLTRVIMLTASGSIEDKV